MSSSPSTRFDGSDIDGLREDEMAIPKKFLEVTQLVSLLCARSSSRSTAVMIPYVSLCTRMFN